jgi:hypothetical protein
MTPGRFWDPLRVRNCAGVIDLERQAYYDIEQRWTDLSNAGEVRRSQRLEDQGCVNSGSLGCEPVK